jgi:preprotein translocase subunit Sec61beta
MAQDNKMQMPGVFGGLMRYDEEYASNFMISPAVVIGFIVAIILLVIVLKLFFPVLQSGGPGVGVPSPINGGLVLFYFLGKL